MGILSNVLYVLLGIFVYIRDILIKLRVRLLILNYLERLYLRIEIVIAVLWCIILIHACGYRLIHIAILLYLLLIIVYLGLRIR